MRQPHVAILAAIGLVGSVLAIDAQQRPAASPGSAARATAAIPRTADGKPDMQGNWSNATYTPLERPDEFKDREFFSVTEAADYGKRAHDGFAALIQNAEFRMQNEEEGAGPAVPILHSAFCILH